MVRGSATNLPPQSRRYRAAVEYRSGTTNQKREGRDPKTSALTDNRNIAPKRKPRLCPGGPRRFRGHVSIRISSGVLALWVLPRVAARWRIRRVTCGCGSAVWQVASRSPLFPDRLRTRVLSWVTVAYLSVALAPRRFGKPPRTGSSLPFPPQAPRTGTVILGRPPGSGLHLRSAGADVGQVGLWILGRPAAFLGCLVGMPPSRRFWCESCGFLHVPPPVCAVPV